MYADGDEYEIGSRAYKKYGAISTLCYGVQWDAIMTYLSDIKVDTSSYINTINTATPDTAKNIYNISKGVFEWTMERGSSDNTKIIRGANSSQEKKAINRKEESIDNVGNTNQVGFRVALYIKVPEDLEKYDKSKWKEKYQEVEYIESSGTQAINTAFIPSSNTIINTKASFTSLPENAANQVCLFGSWNNIPYSFRADSTNYTLYYGTYETNDEYFSSTIIPNTNVHIFETSMNIVKVDGQIVQTRLTNEFASEVPIGLFAQKQKYIYARNSSAKLYYCKIYDNNVLVRDFVPCYRKSDNKPGMYDKVNNVFYTNAGTGEFTVGANVN